MRTKLQFYLFVFSFIFSNSGILFAQTIITRPAIGDCELTFEDNFDGATLNTDIWNYRTDSKHWSTQLPANVSVHDGCLYLNGKKETVGSMNYTGAGIISKSGFRYGYYESRFKIPTGDGWHTSFWMMGHDGSGGTGTTSAYQEIDVCENDSKNQVGYSTNLHNWLGTHTSVNGVNASTPNLSGEFHTWGCEFTPTVVNFYFEGKLVRTVDASKQKHNDSNIWLTTIASYLGNTTAVDDAKLPSAAIYDYVRYYRLLNPIYPVVNPSDTSTVTPNSANEQIIVDNTDAGCTFDSPWTASSFAPGFQGANYFTDGTATADDTKWAKWTPSIPSDGNYNIFMKWTSGANRPSAAPVEIQHGEGTTNTKVDQTINNGNWRFLGNFLLLKGSNNYVKIFANTVGYTIADAVLFERQSINTGLSTTVGDNLQLHILRKLSDNSIEGVFHLPKKSEVSLVVYNELGETINNVLSKVHFDTGRQSFSFRSNTMKAGLYFAVLTIDGLRVERQKFMIK